MEERLEFLSRGEKEEFRNVLLSAKLVDVIATGVNGGEESPEEKRVPKALTHSGWSSNKVRIIDILATRGSSTPFVALPLVLFIYLFLVLSLISI